jgi:hypothetical protein
MDMNTAIKKALGIERCENFGEFWNRIHVGKRKHKLSIILDHPAFLSSHKIALLVSICKFRTCWKSQ